MGVGGQGGFVVEEGWALSQVEEVVELRTRRGPTS